MCITIRHKKIHLPIIYAQMRMKPPRFPLLLNVEQDRGQIPEMCAADLVIVPNGHEVAEDDAIGAKYSCELPVMF